MEVKKESRVILLNDHRLERAYDFARDFMTIHTDKPYHNFDNHVLDVLEVATQLGRFERVSNEELKLLVGAAISHDLIVGGNTENDYSDEEQSAKLIELYYPRFGFKDKEVSEISKLARVTQLTKTPKTRLEEIIRDADVANLGRTDFLKKSELLRQELGKPLSLEWYAGLKKFLDSHKWYTATAQRFYGDGKIENYSLLYQKVIEFMVGELKTVKEYTLAE